MLLRRLAAVLAVSGLSPLVACGDTGDDTATEDTAADDTAADGGDTTEDTHAGEGGGETLEFTAIDIDFERDDVSAAAGELEVSLVNEGEIEHTWTVEGHEDELKLEVASSGDTDEGTITLDAGTYTYYCDVPGHRGAGMEGTLTLE